MTGEKRGQRNSKGSKKKHICGVVVVHKDANRKQVRASFHNPNRSESRRNKTTRGVKTPAFRPEMWKAKRLVDLNTEG